MALLEAAVLLTPEDLSLRLKLLAGYGHFLRTRKEWLSGRAQRDVRRGVPGIIAAYLAYLEHLEYLIRNRRLNGVQAIAAVRGPWPFCIWPNYHDHRSTGSSLLFRDLFQPVTEAEERFLVEVYPILQLPIGRRTKPSRLRDLIRGEARSGRGVRTLWLAGGLFAKDKDGDRGLTPHDLDFLFRLLTEVVPDRCGTPKESRAIP